MNKISSKTYQLIIIRKNRNSNHKSLSTNLLSSFNYNENNPLVLILTQSANIAGSASHSYPVNMK